MFIQRFKKEIKKVSRQCLKKAPGGKFLLDRLDLTSSQSYDGMTYQE